MDKDLTEKYPELKIKCDLDLNYIDEYDGDTKCDKAVTNLRVYSLNSSRITNLLNRTVNVTDLVIKIKPDSKEITLFSVLDSIAKLPLRELTLIVKELKLKQECDQYGKQLNIPLERDKNKKYVMTARDFSSLQKVLNVNSLRFVYLYLNCVPDVQNIYNSFIQSSNNDFSIFRAEFQSYFIQSYRSKCASNIRQDCRYCHEINIDSLHDFNIVEFVRKFKRSPARFFAILCNSDKKWNEIKNKCDGFTKSRKDYRFTLRRIIGEHFDR